MPISKLAGKTPAEVEKIVSDTLTLLRSGVPISRAAQQMNLTPGMIRNWALEAGIPFRTTKGNKMTARIAARFRKVKPAEATVDTRVAPDIRPLPQPVAPAAPAAPVVQHAESTERGYGLIKIAIDMDAMAYLTDLANRQHVPLSRAVSLVVALGRASKL